VTPAHDLARETKDDSRFTLEITETSERRRAVERARGGQHLLMLITSVPPPSALKRLSERRLKRGARRVTEERDRLKPVPLDHK
jgi:hypothetical protein